MKTKIVFLVTITAILLLMATVTAKKHEWNSVKFVGEDGEFKYLKGVYLTDFVPTEMKFSGKVKEDQATGEIKGKVKLHVKGYIGDEKLDLKVKGKIDRCAIFFPKYNIYCYGEGKMTLKYKGKTKETLEKMVIYVENDHKYNDYDGLATIQGGHTYSGQVFNVWTDTSKYVFRD